MACLVAAAVCLAPTLIAHTPLLGWIVDRAAADLDGSVHVGSASLGWFSPIRLNCVEVRDRQGALVASIPEISGNRSLISLALDRTRLGTFRLEKPQLNVVLDPTGSNLQRLIAAYLRPSDAPSPQVGVGVVIADGVVSIEQRCDNEASVTDNQTADSWKIAKLDLAFSMPPDATQAMKLEASGDIVDGREAGGFEVELSMPLASAGGAAAEDGQTEPNVAAGKNSAEEENRLIVKSRSLPLQRLANLLRHFSSDAKTTSLELAGRLDCTARCNWPPNGFAQDMDVSVNAAARGFQFSSKDLGSDRVVLNELTAAGDFGRRSGRFVLKKANIDCDLGRLAFLGEIELDALDDERRLSASGGNALRMLAPYIQQTFQLEGRLDIARLAAMLPTTLHIHEQTKVTSGKLEVALSSSRDEQGMVWKGRIATSDLTAMRRGRELVWQQPIVFTLNARESEAGPVIEEFKCSSTFLHIQAAGWREKLEASLRFDLDRLVQRLDAFVDLRKTNMAGKGWLNLDWRRDKQNAFALDADLQLNGLKLAVGQHRPWSEESIQASLKATGQTDFGMDNRLNTTEIELRLGDDQMRVALTRPVSRIGAATVWPLRVDAHGQLAPWLQRAGAWTNLTGLDMVGGYRLRATVAASAEGVSLDACEINLANLRLNGHGFNVAEQQTRLSLSGKYDVAAGRMLLKNVGLAGRTLQARADNLILGIPQDEPFELSGDVSIQGDLAGLQRWIDSGDAPPAWRIGGQLSAAGRFRQVADVTDGRLQATIADFTAVSAAGRRIVEPKVQIVAAGAYEHSQRMLNFDELKLSSRALNTKLSGKITAADTAAIDGKIDYDMQQLTALLQPYIGAGVFITGRGNRPLSFHGPLSLAGGEARMGFDWSQAYVYGFRVGAGEVGLSLRDGVVQLAPMNLAVSQGQVDLTAQLQLAPGPVELQVAPGPLARQISIDRDMCAYGLQYVAPVLAGVTAAEGRFSVELDECCIPLDNPSAGKLRGRLTVHSVEIGPGPLIREITAALLPGSSSAKLTRESVIHFQMANSRIYHNGLQLQFPQLTIRTKGSVGLDKTLDMVAEMPVPPAWLRDARAAAALSGQTMTLPIRGTLDRPQLDHRRLAEYSREFTRQAASKLIETEVGNQLNRLFGPRK